MGNFCCADIESEYDVICLIDRVHVFVQIRAAVKKQNAGKYATKVKARSKRKQHVANHPAPQDELAGVFRDS